ncbi:MAG: nuclear transport factor 2 family protein [Ferruginibacter sp.]
MKKVLSAGAIALLFFFISCTEKSATTAATTNDAAEKAKANNRAVLKAITAGDVSKIDSFMTNDAVDHSGANGMEEVKGADNIKKDLGSMKQGFSSMDFDVMNETAEGDHLYVLTKMSGTTSATPPQGMQPNMKVEMTGVDMFKFNSDGLISDHWSFNDPKDMMKMMGGGDKMMQPGMDNKMDPKMNDKMMNKKMDTVKKM